MRSIVVRRWPIADIAVGNPLNPAYIPNEILFDHGQEMSFSQRFISTLMTYVLIASNDLYVLPKVEAALQGLLKAPSNPDLVSIMYNDVDFVLHNSHPIFESVVPLMPNSAHVGGAHLSPKNPLVAFVTYP